MLESEMKDLAAKVFESKSDFIVKVTDLDVIKTLLVMRYNTNPSECVVKSLFGDSVSCLKYTVKEESQECCSIYIHNTLEAVLVVSVNGDNFFCKEVSHKEKLCNMIRKCCSDFKVQPDAHIYLIDKHKSRRRIWIQHAFNCLWAAAALEQDSLVVSALSYGFPVYTVTAYHNNGVRTLTLTANSCHQNIKLENITADSNHTYEMVSVYAAFMCKEDMSVEVHEDKAVGVFYSALSILEHKDRFTVSEINGIKVLAYKFDMPKKGRMEFRIIPIDDIKSVMVGIVPDSEETEGLYEWVLCSNSAEKCYSNTLMNFNVRFYGILHKIRDLNVHLHNGTIHKLAECQKVSLGKDATAIEVTRGVLEIVKRHMTQEQIIDFEADVDKLYNLMNIQH